MLLVFLFLSRLQPVAVPVGDQLSVKRTRPRDHSETLRRLEDTDLASGIRPHTHGPVLLGSSGQSESSSIEDNFPLQELSEAIIINFAH